MGKFWMTLIYQHRRRRNFNFLYQIIKLKEIIQQLKVWMNQFISTCHCWSHSCPRNQRRGLGLPPQASSAWSSPAAPLPPSSDTPKSPPSLWWPQPQPPPAPLASETELRWKWVEKVVAEEGREKELQVSSKGHQLRNT